MTTDFSFVSKQAYTAPAYNAVNFAFGQTNDTGLAEITGTATASFSPIVTFAFAGQATQTFNGSASGWAECSTGIAGTGQANLHIYANLDGNIAVAGETSALSFPTQVFRAGTFSEYHNTGTFTVAHQTFGGMGFAVSGNGDTAFEPYYAVVFSGTCAVSMGFGGVADSDLAIDGSTSAAIVSQPVMQTAAWSVGRSIEDCRSTRLRTANAESFGLATISGITGMVAPVSASIDGLATPSIGIGGRFDSVLSASGYATLIPETASYHVASLAIHANGEIVGYLGGIVGSPFGVSSSSAAAFAIDKLLQGLLSAYGLTESIGFGSGYRVQATRYETSFVLIENEERAVSTDKPESNILILSEPTYFTQREEQIPVILHDDEISVVKNL